MQLNSASSVKSGITLSAEPEALTLIMICPCGSGDAYTACCGRFHDQAAFPETALELMRSRYAAYAEKKISYLVATHDPERRSEFDVLSAGQWAAEADWKRLDILNTARGGAEDDTGMVEFIAWFMRGEDLTCHHERSDFRRVSGRWVYSSGSGKAAEQVMTDLGRNELCPCGSGRKFKKCHGM